MPIPRPSSCARSQSRSAIRDHELVPRRLAHRRLARGSPSAGCAPSALAICRADRPQAVVRLRQLGRDGARRTRRLELIEPRVDAGASAPGPATQTSRKSAAAGPTRRSAAVTGADRAAVTEPPRASWSDRTRTPPRRPSDPSGTRALVDPRGVRRILDQQQSAPRGDRAQRRHRGQAAEQVHRRRSPPSWPTRRSRRRAHRPVPRSSASAPTGVAPTAATAIHVAAAV